MKKIFTLITTAMVALCVNAQVLVSYEGTTDLPAGVAISGTTAMANVKINLNKVAKDCIQLKNGYAAEGKFNQNAIILSTDGGFKTGDVLSITGFFNNSDETKVAKAEIFTMDAEEMTTPVWTSEQFINGRTVEADPTPQTYTLEQDMEKIYIGRNGGTGTNILALSVTRGGEAGINNTTIATAAKVAKVATANGIVIKTAKGKFNVAGVQVK